MFPCFHQNSQTGDISNFVFYQQHGNRDINFHQKTTIKTFLFLHHPAAKPVVIAAMPDRRNDKNLKSIVTNQLVMQDFSLERNLNIISPVFRQIYNLGILHQKCQIEEIEERNKTELCQVCLEGKNNLCLIEIETAQSYHWVVMDCVQRRKESK